MYLRGSGLRTQKLVTLVWRKIKALFVLALRPSISYPNFTFRTTDPRSRPGVNFRDTILYQKGHGIELETLPGCICSVCCLGNRLLLFGINLLFRLTFGGLTLVLNWWHNFILNHLLWLVVIGIFMWLSSLALFGIFFLIDLPKRMYVIQCISKIR